MKINNMIAAMTAICLIGGTVPTVYRNTAVNAITANALVDDDGNEYTEVKSGYLTYYVYPDHAKLIKCDKTAKEEIIIPAEIKNTPVTMIADYSFSDCTEITSVTLPESITSIGGNVFSFCTSLSDIYIPATVKNIGGDGHRDKFNGFDHTPWLEAKQKENPLVIINGILIDGTTYIGDLVIPDNVIEINSSSFYDCEGITSVTIPDSVKKIGDSAFTHCTSLKTVNIGNGITEIPGHRITGGWTGVFGWCENLESVEMSDSIKKIGEYAFYKCPSLSDITFSKNIAYISDRAFDDTLWYQNQPDGLIYIGKTAFKYKGDMPENTTIKIKDGIEGIGEFAFSEFKELTSIEFPDSLKNIGSRAFYNAGIEVIEIPNSVSYMGEAVFANCESLKKCKLPDNISSLPSQTFAGYFYGYFSECKSLTEVTLPVKLSEIDRMAFSKCDSLKSIIIPESVKKIGSYAFEYCTDLESIIIPKSVEEIDAYAFSECPSLGAITIQNPNCEIFDNGFTICNGEDIAGTIYGHTDSTAQAYAAKYKYHFVPLGDSNGDKEVNVADAVMLQRYLLGNDTLGDWRAADLCADGKIDIFDMVFMRKLLINNN